MRLCFIAEGISIHTKRWVDYFIRTGHEVHLISAQFSPDYQKYDSRITVYPLVRFLPRFWKITRYISGVMWLFQVRKLLKKINPDILDCHYVTINGYLGVVSGFHPLVLTAWGSDILIAPKRSFIHKFLTGISLRRADLIISLSFTMTEELIKLGAQKNRIHEIMIGVDPSKFKPFKDYNYLKKDIGISGATPIIISTRNLEPVYDIKTLLRAIALVSKNIPEIKCIIIGEGNQKEKLHKMVESLNIRNNVVFLGRFSHDELPKYLAISDIYISTSLSDGASNSLMEAMATGLAPIVSDIPANRSFITDGQNGFLFPTQNHEILAERIHYLIESKETRDMFGQLNRDIILDRADHNKEMLKVNILYEELATEGKRL